MVVCNVPHIEKQKRYKLFLGFASVLGNIFFEKNYKIVWKIQKLVLSLRYNYKEQDIMNQTAGIIIEKNARGTARYSRIDLKRYGKLLIPFFKSVDAEKEVSSYNPQFVDMIKAQEKMPGVKIKASDIWK